MLVRIPVVDVQRGGATETGNRLAPLLQVSYREVDIVMGVIDKSADTLRERWNLGPDGASAEEVYR